MAFHEATGEEGKDPKWVRESGKRPGKEGSMKLNAEVLTAPTAAQSAKATANPPKNIEITAALAHFKRTLRLDCFCSEAVANTSHF